jgi:hypothetical protein
MAKFNLYAADGSVTEGPAFRQAATVVDGISARSFATGLGLWFVVMFAFGCLILAA